MTMAERIDIPTKLAYELHEALGDVIDVIIETDCGLDLDRFKEYSTALAEVINASEGDPPYYYVSPRWRFDRFKEGAE